MQQHSFGTLPKVSTLTLGGGGLGMLWGKTTFDECVATVHDAVAAGINLLDLAPRYGDGKAEEVVGAAYGGKLPAGVRVTSKCNLGNAVPAEVEGILRKSIEQSLQRLKLGQLELFFLHSNIVPDQAFIDRAAKDASVRMTPYATFVDRVRPAFERFVSEGLVAAWGLTGIGQPDTLIKVLGEQPKPAAIQCIANLLDSPGGLKFFPGPAKPRAVIAAARAAGVGVMGIRAVQAGALTSAIDRTLSPNYPDRLDYDRAAPFRALCASWGEDPAVVAHRYALRIQGVDTLVLGVKNRAELRQCLDAEAAGPLDVAQVAAIDALGLRQPA
jgi:aryl-alcohol dehydrogenase-like predicted oxidoreductase